MDGAHDPCRPNDLLLLGIKGSTHGLHFSFVSQIQVGLNVPASASVVALAPVRSASVLPQTGSPRQLQVLAFIPFSKSTLWRRINAGTVPAPVELSVKVTA